MAGPQSKRAAPVAAENGSKKQMQQRSAGGTYRNPAAAASSPGADALRAAQASLAFGRTMLEAIELLREAHPDNEPLGAAFALMEPIETMLIDAVQAAERALPAKRPLEFDPARMRLLQSGDGWKVLAFDDLESGTRVSVHDGRFQGGTSGVSIRLSSDFDGCTSFRLRGQRSERIDKVQIYAVEPNAQGLRKMIAFLHHVLNDGGEL